MNDNNTTVRKALSDIVASYGVEVFADVTRANALLMDFIPQCDKERKLIVLALKEGMGAELQKIASIGEDNRKQIALKWEKHLVSDNWIAKEAANWVVCQLLEAVTGGNFDDEAKSDRREEERAIHGGVELIKGAHEESENPDDYLSEYQVIGYKAFASNTQLKTISISDSIRIIRPKAFYNCINLYRIEIPSSVVEIGRKAFAGCGSLKEIITPRPQKYVCKAGLLINTGNGTLLRSANAGDDPRIIIPDNVQAIQEYAFDESAAKQIVLPRSLVSFETAAFHKCLSLESFEIPVSNPYFSCIEGVIHTKDCKILLKYPVGSGRTSYILEDGVVEVARDAFAGAINLESITFPSGLLKIGEKAFAECKNMRSVMLPATVQSIGERAFQECERLEHVMLPRGIEEIGDCAFSRCENLQSLSIPRSVVRIGNMAFNRCRQLKRVVIQDKVSFIGDGAFSGCANDIEIAISNNPYVETYCRTRGIAISKI